MARSNASAKEQARELFGDDAFRLALTHATKALGALPQTEILLGNTPLENQLSYSETLVLSTPEDGLAANAKRYLRGQSDLAALTMHYHNASVHHSQRPVDSHAAQLFDALEQVRIEALGSANMQGVQQNLAHRSDIYYQQQAQQQCDQTPPPMADILAMNVREVIDGSPPPSAIEAQVRKQKLWLEQKAKGTLLQLAGALDEQKTYAQLCIQLLQALSLLPEALSSQPDDEQQNETEDEAETAADQAEQPDENESSSSESQSESGEQSEEASDDDAAQQLLGDDQADAVPPEAGQQHRPNHPQFHGLKPLSNYQAYCTDFDEEIEADSLITHEELSGYRQQLDEQLRQHHNIHTRLSAKLQRLLMAQQLREWVYDQEDGLIDNARLARLVIHPDMQAIYKYEKESTFRDSVVSLLIDNSGSMRGRPIALAAISADILARTLERCGVKVEILGFTTSEWKGGKSRKRWEKSGKPPTPGRLNDLRHIIYKSADMRMNKGRRNLALMLKDGLLKENIDGEALLWAHSRLLARPEQRRILMIISDGAPVDDSTLSTNSSGYLDKHLREVIEMIELRSDVELSAIGIGHDVGRYYKRAVTIHEASQLGDTMLTEMMRLFAK